jgi:hypothetical protein
MKGYLALACLQHLHALHPCFAALWVAGWWTGLKSVPVVGHDMSVLNDLQIHTHGLTVLT